ncbi:MAG: hypothetical protein Q7K45_02920 [Nanoarchaeota archaeon]|nr:hypothetical protein [Nanoarchaeota archaeon]
MTDKNPFDILGIKKEILDYLHRQGELEPFLNKFYKLSAFYIHPDRRGGNKELSSRVNGAHDQLRDHPENIETWLSTMEENDNHNAEYLAMIGALTEKVNKLLTEQEEYELLKRKYAELLIQSRDEITEGRTVSEPARTHSSPFEPKYGAPPTSEPKSTSSKRKSNQDKSDTSISTKLITLEDIRLYDAHGETVRTYETITLSGEVKRLDTGGRLQYTSDQWKIYYEDRKEKLPPLPLMYAIMKRLHAENHFGIPGLRKELRMFCLTTSTHIDYRRNRITHGDDMSHLELENEIPLGNHELKDIKGKEEWAPVLQALFMPLNIHDVGKVLHFFFGVPPYLWTSSDRKKSPVSTVFIGADAGRVGIGGGGDLSTRGFSRSVQEGR